MEHGGLCCALIRRRTRFDSWHLDETTEYPQWRIGRVRKGNRLENGGRRASVAQVRILHPPRVASSTGQSSRLLSDWFGVRVPGDLPDQPGLLAQLRRAVGLYPNGSGFESPATHALMVQRIRHRSPKAAIQVRLLLGAPFPCGVTAARLTVNQSDQVRILAGEPIRRAGRA